MNKQRMLELAEYIDKNAGHNSFDMGLYTHFRVDFSETEDPVCKTAGCIAGWAWIKEHPDYIERAQSAAIKDHVPTVVEQNDAKYFYGMQTTLKPSVDWAIDNNVSVLSPEREFAEGWLELSKQEASELFLCERDGYNIWDRHSDDLGIPLECGEDCQGFNGCIGECDYVRLEDITKEDAVTMLRKLGTGEWSFNDEDK